MFEWYINLINISIDLMTNHTVEYVLSCVVLYMLFLTFFMFKRPGDNIDFGYINFIVVFSMIALPFVLFMLPFGLLMLAVASIIFIGNKLVYRD